MMYERFPFEEPRSWPGGGSGKLIREPVGVVAAGLPEGVVSIVPAGREVGEYLVRHPGVDKITFAGAPRPVAAS